MKIMVTSGAGLIGSKSVAILLESRHTVIAANAPARFGR